MRDGRPQTKKRYVGYMYESPGQSAPGFDAKGIETVRRDGCPAVSKLLEHSLRLLFSSRDLSLVKEYLRRQWSKILANRQVLLRSAMRYAVLHNAAAPRCLRLCALPHCCCCAAAPAAPASACSSLYSCIPSNTRIHPA